MDIRIKATNFELTPAIQSLVEEKMNSLSKFLAPFEPQGTVLVNVEVGKTTAHHKKGPFFRAEADIRLPGRILRAEAADVKLNLAILRVKNELQMQIKAYRGASVAKARRGERVVKKRKTTAKEALLPGETDISKRE